jgi:NhaP-type Na+/H+ or K+/H+ antiporter
MHHHLLLILFALLIFAFGLVSLFAESHSITGPMVFMTVAIYSAKVKHQAQEFGETEGMQLILVVFLIFGLAMVRAAVPYWGVRELIYALASLTILRMLPVAISLIGAKLDWQAITFIGWFGPRGIASVLYLLMAVAAIGQEEYEQVMSVIVLTVAISVYAHGICATPLSLRYGASRPSLDR